MADSLARLIVILEAESAKYQKGMEDAQNRLAKFQGQQTQSLARVENNFKSFSRTVGQILQGGGILIGFRVLANELGKVAEQFKGQDQAARDFIRVQKELKDSTDSLWRSLLNLSGPLIKGIADQMDPAALATRRLAIATSDLAKAEKALADARADNRSNFNLLNKLPQLFGGGKSVAELEKERDAAQAALVAARASVSATALARSNVSGALDPTGPAGLVGTILQGLEKTAAAQKKLAEEQERRTAQEIKDQQEMIKASKEAYDDRLRAVQHGYDMEEAYAEEMKQTWVNIDEGIEKALAIGTTTQQEKLQAELDKMEEATQRFGDLFADVLIQSNKDGLKQVLADFVQTLAIMALRAQGMNIFNRAVSSGGWFGGALTAIFGGGRAMGGPVAAGVPYMVGERGPEMFVPSGSGSISANRGGVTINQNVTVGAGASRAEVMAAMTIAKNAAKAEINNDRRRGR